MTVTPVQSAFADTGNTGTGSDAVTSLAPPRILVAAGDGISETSYGWLWHFLVPSGVEHFDHTNSPLGSDVVRDVAVDPRDGKVWIGTAAGLHRFDPAYVPPAPPTVEQLHVRRMDVSYLAAGVLVLWAAGLLATWFPALKGARVAPAVATRNV